MKKLTRISIFLLSISILSSCIRVKTVLTVNKDGTGTIQETVLMSKLFADMINSFSSMSGDENTKPFSLFDQEKLQKNVSGYGEGVNYQSGKPVKDSGWEGYTATYTFQDISKVKLSLDQEGKVDTGMNEPNAEEEMKEDEYYYFSFNGGNTPELTINRKEIEEVVEEEVKDMDIPSDEENGLDEMGKQMMKMLDGMRFDMAVVVNGKVTQTNASYVDGSTITLLDMDFGEMMKNQEGFLKMTKKKPNTTAEMKAFVDEMPGMKLELEEKVTVRFK